jgi:uncharacterized protein (TIGR02001 family)
VLLDRPLSTKIRQIWGQPWAITGVFQDFGAGIQIATKVLHLFHLFWRSTMKKTLLAVTMAALALPLSSQAAESGLGITGNFGFTSNYKYRGISQSADKVAAQGGFDVSHGSGLYLGAWTSNVADWANYNGNGQEIDIYGGFKTELPAGIGLDIGALQYYYPGTGINLPAAAVKKPNTLEYYVGLSYGPIAYKFSQTSDLFFGAPGSKNSTYQNINAKFPLSEKVSLSASFGEQKVKGSGNPTYNDYGVGVSYALPADFSVTLSYIGTSGLSAAEKVWFTYENKKLYEAKTILTVSKSF